MSDKSWKDITPIETTRLHAQIASRLEDMIVSGVIQPGERLPSEQQMAIQFGVSRTVIRDAIRVLSARGLIEAHQGKQSVVTFCGRKALRDVLQLVIRRINYSQDELIEFRKIFEPYLARCGAEKATQNQIDQMERALLQYQECLKKAEFQKAELAHQQFHLAIAETSQNHLIQDVLGEILRAATTALFPLIDWDDEWEDFNIHRDLLEAIKQRDAGAAFQIMEMHMQRSEIQLLKQESKLESAS